MHNLFVVLATYNGAAYLGSQLDSIRRQSLEDWTLLACDDGSTDATLDILHRAAVQDPRIVIVQEGERRGATGNFCRTLQWACQRGAQYVFLADQDDLWHPEKLRRQLELLLGKEGHPEGRQPCLAYSDLAIIDAQGTPRHPSFLRWANLRGAEGRPLPALLGRSFVLGCAAAMNRPLLEFALPVPPCVAWHDWWLALCAAAVGHIAFLPEPLLQYRRHGGNASGWAGFWESFNPLRYSWRRRWRTGIRAFWRSIAMAQALQRRLDERGMTAPQPLHQQLDAFCRLFQEPLPGWQRLRELHRLGLPDLQPARRRIYDLCVLATGGREVRSYRNRRTVSTS